MTFRLRLLHEAALLGRARPPGRAEPGAPIARSDTEGAAHLDEVASIFGQQHSGPLDAARPEDGSVGGADGLVRGAQETGVTSRIAEPHHDVDPDPGTPLRAPASQPLELAGMILPPVVTREGLL